MSTTTPERAPNAPLATRLFAGETPPSWLAALAIVLLALAAHAPALGCGFVWDDDHHFVNFPMITDPNGLARIWIKHEYYYPLTSTVWWVAWRIWGARPLPYHLINVVLHGLNAALLWRVLRRLRVPAAWLAAAAFAVHPVTAQSVAWATELKNCLSALFYLASLLAWLAWLEARRDARVGVRSGEQPREQPGRRANGDANACASEQPPGDHADERAKGSPWFFYGASLACFVLAVAAKTPSIVLAPALFLATLRVGVRWDRRMWAAWAPFWGVVAFSGWVTVQGQVVMTGGATWSQPMTQRVPLAARAFWFYLGKLAWPTDLSFVYTLWPETALGQSPSWAPLAAMAALFGALAALAAFGRGAWRVAGRATLLAALYYLVALSPALGFFKMYYNRYSWVADHWQYLAMMGALAWGVGGAAWLAGRLLPGRAMRPVGLACGAALLAMLGGLTQAQDGVYRDPATLWTGVLARNPTSIIAREQLGVADARRGRLLEAEFSLRDALRLAPGDAEVKVVLGGVLAARRQWAEAAQLFEDATRAMPRDYETWNNLGSARLRMGDVRAAIRAYGKALALAPGDAGVVVSYARALAEDGRRAEALAALDAALRRGVRDPRLAALRRVIAAQQAGRF